jgi:putative ABC transport system permease protein
MTALHHKLLRDLWLLRGPAVAIGLVMACGIATFVMSLSVLSTLYRTRAAYYDRFRFADVFAPVKRAPDAMAARLAEIPGVLNVETRISELVNLDLASLAEPATGRLLSLPDRGEPRLNALFLREGRWPEAERSDEALISDGFAAAHRLHPGATVRAILNGRRQDLRVVGIALSPEFVYQIRPGEIIPDDRRFGVFWMRRRALEAVFQMEGAFNEAVLKLTPAANEREVIRRIDALTAPYGATGAYGRRDQSSHKFVSNEMNELRGMAMVIPAIFLIVAAWLLQVVMSRLIGTQREQIATLKAFGYTGREVGVHYLQLVLVIAGLGTLLGIGVGAWLGRGVAAIYVRFFHFPSLHFQLDGRVALAATAISSLAAVLAVSRPIRQAMRLPPAVAMRPEMPLAFGATWLESWLPFRRAPVDVRMILRYLSRRPGRTALTCLGLSLALAVLILGSFMLDGLNYVMESEFNVSQRQDLSLTLVEPTNRRVVGDVRHLPGVRSVEPYRSVAVRLRSGPRERLVGLMGLPTNSRLFRIADVDRKVRALPISGLVLSERLAQTLSVRPGDAVTVEALEGKRRIRELRVASLVADFQGQAAYAPLEDVHRLMQESDAVTGVFVAFDAARTGELYAELKKTPRLVSATMKGAALASLRETIVANILKMRAFNVAFACIIACGVAYNSARIALSERSRELATLRVIGFTRGEIARILLGELGLLTLAAVPLGIVLGHILADLVIRIAYDTELFRIPLVISRWTDAFAASVLLASSGASGWLMSRRLARLDLVAVLKARE